MRRCPAQACGTECPAAVRDARRVEPGFIVSGTIAVETVFSWPGLGQLTWRAANAGPDYPLLQGLFLLFSVAVIFANLAADLLLGVLDPRIGRV